MRSRIAGRRVLTAGGIYSSAVVGFLGQILAARWLGVEDYGIFAIVLSITGFVQLVTDLTVEEAVIKYGFRYQHSQEWGKLRRLYRRAFQIKIVGALLAAVVIAALAPAGRPLFGHSGLLGPLLVASLLPLAQAPEGLAGCSLLLRSRYDVRSFFLLFGQLTRFAALAAGSRIGVLEAVLFMVVAQAVTTIAVGVAGVAAFRRWPRVAPVPLGEDRREIVRFMKQSAIASTMTTFQGAVPPLVLGLVTSPRQVGLYRVALAPQGALATLSAPIRMILLTEQTRDWEKGDVATVLAGVRRFTLLASLAVGVVMAPLLVFLPDLVRLVYSEKYAAAGNAARWVLVSSVLMLVIGWSKSLPVSIGRPALRIWTHAIQAAVLIPATALFGIWWGASGAAAALALSTGAFVVAWGVIVVRLHREHHAVPAAPAPSAAPVGPSQEPS